MTRADLPTAFVVRVSPGTLGHAAFAATGRQRLPGNTAAMPRAFAGAFAAPSPWLAAGRP